MTKSMFPDFNADEIDQAFETLDAVREMAELFIRCGTSHDVAKVLGCSETIHLANVLSTAGFHDEADDWLSAHIASDTDLTCDEVREIHGTCPCVEMDAECDSPGRCGICLNHPGWAHDDEARRTLADYCRACLGSGRTQN